MPYPRQEVLSLKDHVLYFMNDKEKLQIALNKVQQERNSWRNKYRILSVENAKIQKILKEKEALIEILEQHVIEKDELFSSENHSGNPYNWQRSADTLTTKEARLKRQKRIHQQMVGSPPERMFQNS